MPVLIKPAVHGPALDDEIKLTCKSCGTDIKMKQETFERQMGRLVRCPSCRTFIKVARPVEHEEGQEAVSGSEEELPAGDTAGGSRALARTMRLDTLLDYLPQTKSVQESKCPYCTSPLRHLSERAFICDKCQRVIRTISR